MLDKTVPADVIPFLYPYTQQLVRTHRHTEDNSVWLVLADVCRIMGLTNTTYVTSKLNKDKTYKHLVYTDGGKQTVTWVELSEVQELCRRHNAVQFLNWLNTMQVNVPLPAKQATQHIFADPVIIERSTLNKFLELYEDLKRQNLI